MADVQKSDGCSTNDTDSLNVESGKFSVIDNIDTHLFNTGICESTSISNEKDPLITLRKQLFNYHTMGF